MDPNTVVRVLSRRLVGCLEPEPEKDRRERCSPRSDDSRPTLLLNSPALCPVLSPWGGVLDLVRCRPEAVDVAFLRVHT